MVWGEKNAYPQDRFHRITESQKVLGRKGPL